MGRFRIRIRVRPRRRRGFHKSFLGGLWFWKCLIRSGAGKWHLEAAKPELAGQIVFNDRIAASDKFRRVFLVFSSPPFVSK
jgi:hypothetical protein